VILSEWMEGGGHFRKWLVAVHGRGTRNSAWQSIKQGPVLPGRPLALWCHAAHLLPAQAPEASTNATSSASTSID
jgi:hypothetical protein